MHARRAPAASRWACSCVAPGRGAEPNGYRAGAWPGGKRSRAHRVSWERPGSGAPRSPSQRLRLFDVKRGRAALVRARGPRLAHVGQNRVPRRPSSPRSPRSGRRLASAAIRRARSSRRAAERRGMTIARGCRHRAPRALPTAKRRFRGQFPRVTVTRARRRGRGCACVAPGRGSEANAARARSPRRGVPVVAAPRWSAPAAARCLIGKAELGAAPRALPLANRRSAANSSAGRGSARGVVVSAVVAAPRNSAPAAARCSMHRRSERLHRRRRAASAANSCTGHGSARRCPSGPLEARARTPKPTSFFHEIKEPVVKDCPLDRGHGRRGYRLYASAFAMSCSAVRSQDDKGGLDSSRSTRQADPE
jgi:hypothetical protein